jgi:Tfp pilus assembly protein PilE
MGKIRQNEAGFSPVEVVLVIVVVALIGVVGWLVYKNHNKSTNTSSTTANTTSTKTTTQPVATNTKTYADPAKAYTVAYPQDWALKEEALNGLDQATPLDSTKARFTPSNLPSGASGNTWVGISSFKGDINTVFKEEAYAPSESYSPQTQTINGYQALYHQEVVPATQGQNGAAGGMGWTDDYYAVTNNGITLVFYFREKEDGNGVGSSFDASSIVPAYTALVKSVKFTN